MANDGPIVTCRGLGVVLILGAWDVLLGAWDVLLQVLGYRYHCYYVVINVVVVIVLN